jgi:hypothetical protein
MVIMQEKSGGGRANHIVYVRLVSGMQEKANKKHNAKSRAKKVCCDKSVSCNIQKRKNDQKKMDTWRSVGSRRLRPQLPNFDFDAVNGTADKMSHLPRCQSRVRPAGVTLRRKTKRHRKIQPEFKHRGVLCLFACFFMLLYRFRFRPSLMRV